MDKEYELLPELEDILNESQQNYGYEHEYEYEAPSVTLGNPTVTPVSGAVVKPTNCITPAVNLIPKFLDAKLMGCLNKVVPSKDTVFLFEKTWQQNGAAIWVDKLNTDLKTFLIVLYPQVNLTIELWRFIKVPSGNRRTILVPLSNYLRSKSGEYTVSIIAPVTSKATVEKISGLSVAGLLSSAGPLPSINYEYYFHVYATFPNDVKNYFRQVEWSDIDKFPLNKADLSASQLAMIQRTAYDIAQSWLSQSTTRYVGVTIEGHADERGTEAYNMGLGKKRAEVVADALKKEIARLAAGVMDLSKMNIKYDIVSYGETRPISKKPVHRGDPPVDYAANRRVEITLHGISVPASVPLDLDNVITRCLQIIRSQASMDSGMSKRLQCVLNMLRRPDTDDRFVIGGQGVLNIQNNHRMPNDSDVFRLRFALLQAGFFGAPAPVDRVLQSLYNLDAAILEAKDKINQIIELQQSATSWSVDKIRGWIKSQVNNPNSIYSCYRGMI